MENCSHWCWIRCVCVCVGCKVLLTVLTTLWPCSGRSRSWQLPDLMIGCIDIDGACANRPFAQLLAWVRDGASGDGRSVTYTWIAPRTASPRPSETLKLHVGDWPTVTGCPASLTQAIIVQMVYYVTLPGFHGFEDAQTGCSWVARQKLTDASCRERYCWERRNRLSFDCEHS